MLRCLSIKKLLPVLFFCAAFGYGAEVTVTPIRPSGASLDPSLRNEADHAVRQAAFWLSAQQQPDGAWGESNRVRLTAMALFALKASRHPACSGPCANAALWLDGTATNRIDNLETHAWRLLALAFVLPDAPSRTNLLRRLADRAGATEAGASCEARLFWSEVLPAAGLGEPSRPQPSALSNRLAQAAASWPPAPKGNADVWRLARLINRAGHGQLVRGNTPLDWRADLARRLINTQRKAPAGGGFWNAQSPDGQTEETALGLLALLEL